MTASIGGFIKSEQGDPVAGILVKLVHEPTGSVFAKSSNLTGHYQFESVQAGGPYHLSVDTDGAGTIKADTINLKIDEVFTHDFIL